MKQWFDQLAPRERRFVTVGTVTAGLLVLYLAVVEPIAGAFSEQRQRVERLEQELAWMVRAAAEVHELRAAGARDMPAGSDRAPYLAVDDAVRDAGLPVPVALEPIGADGARVEFDHVSHSRLLVVLAALQAEQGLRVTRASLGRVDNGMVRARLTLERREP